MRYVLLTFIILIGIAQWILWFGKDGVIDLWQSRQNLAASKLQTDDLEQRNNVLKAEVLDLQTGLQAVEERARSELGLVKEDEVFIQIIETDSANKTPENQP